QAANDITLGTVNTTQSSYSHTYTQSSGLFSSRSTTDIQSSNSVTANGTSVSGNSVFLDASNDIALQGSQLAAQSGITAEAGGNINILSAQNTLSQQHDHASSKSGLGFSGYQKNSQQVSDTLNTVTQTGSTIQTQTGNVVLVANLNQSADPYTGIVNINGSQIDAASGQVLIGAKHILIGASENQTQSTHTSKSSKSAWSFDTGLPSGKQLNDVASAQQDTLNGSTINGATGIMLDAQGLVNVDASQLTAAQGDINITGANVNLQSDLNSSSASNHATQSNTGVSVDDILGTFRPGQGQNYKAGLTTKNADTTLVNTTLNAQNINIQSTAGDITLGAIQATAHGSQNADGTRTPGSINLDAAHNLNFTTIQTTRQQSTDVTQSDIAWQVKKGSGAIDQTTRYTQLNAQILNMTAANRITATMSVKNSAAILAKEPGMGWMQTLLTDPKLSSKVDWNQIQEIHNHWNYRAQGLTPAAAAVITIVVMYFTSVDWNPGAAVTTNTVGAAAITAGVATIASQASISLIDNGGNIDATLKTLGGSQDIRQDVAAMLTAGAIQELKVELPIEVVKNAIAISVISNVTGAAINSAIEQKPLLPALRTAIEQGLIQGNVPDANTQSFANGFTNILAGCGIGMAAGGASRGSACGAGALGALAYVYYTGDITPTGVDPATYKTDRNNFVDMMVAIGGALLDQNVTEINISGKMPKLILPTPLPTPPNMPSSSAAQLQPSAN
ncbi:MAG: hemagglutinin repeat-containing protein, partial [Betaproteobacteria bacterium]|nr:hemagglutinin repeat-containing protein [Betaproteobacteria bacterium]